MEDSWNQDRPQLLSRLRMTPEDLVSPTLLERLDLQEQFQTLPLRLDEGTSGQKTLLQRINDSGSLEILKTPLSPLEVRKSPKRPLSPPSCGFSETLPTYPSPRCKRIRLSTPISVKYSRSTRRSASPEFRMKTNTTENQHLRMTTCPREVQGNSPNLLTPMTRARMAPPQSDRSYRNPTCHGSKNLTILSSDLATPVARKPVGFYEHSTETSPNQNSSSKSQETLLQESRPHNGKESSKETPSTSIKSSRHSTMLSLMRRERDAWETRKLLLGSLNPKSAFPPQQNGLPPGERLPRPSPSLSPIEGTNLSTTGNTLNRNSQQNSFPPTTKSYSMTSPYATKLREVKTSYSLTTKDLADSTPPSLCQTELNLLRNLRRTRNPPVLPILATNRKSATNLTLGSAKIPTPSASTDTSARNARSRATAKRIAPTPGASEIYGLQPRYLRHNLWEKGSSLSSTTAEWSETADPLPRPPELEVSNPVYRKTIADNPNLFLVSTPINVDVFETLLKDHPNPAFVKSVCTGLREGFWPWADTLSGGFPISHDETRPESSNPDHAAFIRDQCLKERRKGHFSEPFGTNLLPGMYSMPIHAVPKPHSSDLRLINDHSAGLFSLNSMIDHTKVTGFPLDNMRHVGEMLFDVRRSQGQTPLDLWKSDIADAYRLLPMSPFWQIKQIVTVDGQRHVDHKLCFGSSASSGIFISFDSLVAWIAKNVKKIRYILDYMDDSSGCNRKGDTLFYPPYEVHLPSDQCRLLLLWDELGIPHKRHKQIFGSPLTIIGIDVDPNAMTMTLPTESKEQLTKELRSWTAKPPRNASGSFKLKHWERLAGWFNWALNVYPLLRPALNNVYAKMTGKRLVNQRIYINNAIRNDLMWAVNHIESSNGVQLFESYHWDPPSADFVIYCDACPEGLGFWYPISKDGYYAPTPVNIPSNAIFYYEALCVLSAIMNVQSKAPRNSKILIYTDNTNSVDIFRSLRCLPDYNPLLKSAVDILIANNFSLRVLHVPGEDNIVADALSRVQFSVALSYEPGLKLFDFNPPDLVGSTV
jgi:hypothetical protein